MKTLVAVPMKAYSDAKTRLACTMGEHERARVAGALFEYGQTFFAAHYPDFDRLVVTPSPMVAAAAVQAGASCVYEPVATGLDAAATAALRWAMDHKYERLLIAPGDIAIWLKEELDCLLELNGEFDVVVARARDGGTNAIVMNLPGEIRFRYGPNSAAKHVDEARRIGRRAVECSLPFLALDLDTPEDHQAIRDLGHRNGVTL